MTKEEAEKVIEILCNADGACGYCGADLIRDFIRQFPEFTELGHKIFDEHFPDLKEKL